MLRYSFENNTSGDNLTWEKSKKIPTFKVVSNYDSLLIINNNEIDSEKEFKKEDFTVRNLESFDNILEIEFPMPVYVLKDEKGEESVYYNSNEMEQNMFYEITWNGEKWALKRTAKEIEFHRWIPDK